LRLRRGLRLLLRRLLSLRRHGLLLPLLLLLPHHVQLLLAVAALHLLRQ
jgi:hypothetical protein